MFWNNMDDWRNHLTYIYKTLSLSLIDRSPSIGSVPICHMHYHSPMVSRTCFWRASYSSQNYRSISISFASKSSIQNSTNLPVSGSSTNTSPILSGRLHPSQPLAGTPASLYISTHHRTTNQAPIHKIPTNISHHLPHLTHKSNFPKLSQYPLSYRNHSKQSISYPSPMQWYAMVCIHSPRSPRQPPSSDIPLAIQF